MGLRHIGYNTILLITLGVICELQNGFIITAVAFQSGVLYGTLGFNHMQPYFSILGASHGVCGLLGASFANITLNGDCFPKPEMLYVLWFISFTILFAEIMDYVFNYESGTAYAAHAFGFLGGLFVGFSIVPILKGSPWKLIVRIVNIILAITLLTFLVCKYVMVWPPIYPTYIHARNEPVFCCSEMLSIAKQQHVSVDEVRKSYSCRYPDHI